VRTRVGTPASRGISVGRSGSLTRADYITFPTILRCLGGSLFFVDLDLDVDVDLHVVLDLVAVVVVCLDARPSVQAHDSDYVSV
jgi:hypothetical protein